MKRLVKNTDPIINASEFLASWDSCSENERMNLICTVDTVAIVEVDAVLSGGVSQV